MIYLADYLPDNANAISLHTQKAFEIIKCDKVTYAVTLLLNAPLSTTKDLLMSTPHTVVSQLVSVTTDTFLSLEGCNTFQAEAKLQPLPDSRYSS